MVQTDERETVSPSLAWFQSQAISIPSEVNEDNDVQSSILGRGVPQQSLLHYSIESCDGKPLSPWLVLFS